MRLAEIILTEASLPADFEFSNWGYWIEPDGSMRPVQRHQHAALYRIGFEASASGRIRVTAIVDPTVVKTVSGKRIFSADFFAHYVTKMALHSLSALLARYDFEEYWVSGLTYIAPEDMAWQDGEDNDAFDRRRLDPRSLRNGKSKKKALEAVRNFGQTARDAIPPQHDATPISTFKQPRRPVRRTRFGR